MTDALWQSVLAFGLELDTVAPREWMKVQRHPCVRPVTGERRKRRKGGGKKGRGEGRERMAVFGVRRQTPEQGYYLQELQWYGLEAE